MNNSNTNSDINSNISISNCNNIYDYLKYYKEYITLLKNKKEYNYMKKINSYKFLCFKLIKMSNRNDLEKIGEKINYKLKKNQHNKKVLEKIKNILFELNNNNNNEF